jgi:hypothetical protein
MGCAIIRSNNPLLENPVVLNMVLDVLAGEFVGSAIWGQFKPLLAHARVRRLRGLAGPTIAALGNHA